jgi:DNA replication protein DnaC
MEMSESICPHCGGSGWKIVERVGASGAERCNCRESERAGVLEERAGIPPLYRTASLDTFKLPQDNPNASKALSFIKNIVGSYADDYPLGSTRGLLLIGETGTGKTHLAVAALRKLIEKGYEGVFFDFQTLLSCIRAGYDKHSESSDRKSLRTALDAEILLLDDLGAHRIKEFVEDAVTEIITHRCNNQKALIVTTNLIDDTTSGENVERDSGLSEKIYSKYKLGERIGARARSRLFEMCRVVRMPRIEDYRLRNRKVY